MLLLALTPTCLVTGPGCAHKQLSVSTVLTANTHQTILFHMVLDNIAMFAVQPDTMPWHTRVRDGTVQVQDQLGIGQNGGGLTAFNGTRLGIDTYGLPQGSRKVALQWGTDAVGDPVQLFALQTVYRRLLGLPPLPAPNFIVEAQRARMSGAGGSGSSGRALNDNDAETRSGLSSMEVAYTGEIVTGWFCVGRKRDVPRDAAFVGHHDGCYVWVMPEGVGGLTRYTLLVLSIVKLTAGDGDQQNDGQGGQHGLMFTPSG